MHSKLFKFALAVICCFGLKAGQAEDAPPNAAKPGATTPGAQSRSQFAKKMRGSKAGELRTFNNELDLKLVWCPPGKFLMGSPESDVNATEREKPPVNVTLSKGYWLGQTEVTQKQWTKVMGAGPWKKTITFRVDENGQAERNNPNMEGDNCPAGYLNWLDAEEFCEKLTDQERQAGRLTDDYSYRLPTEAEWEYACRAGTRTAYYFGDKAEELKDHAWFKSNTEDIGEQYAHEVKLKKPNPWGLYDMHGNTSEWCQDSYSDKLTGGRDPLVTTKASVWVLRGGDFVTGARFNRSAWRHGMGINRRYLQQGMRVVLSESTR